MPIFFFNYCSFVTFKTNARGRQGTRLFKKKIIINVFVTLKKKKAQNLEMPNFFNMIISCHFLKQACTGEF